MICFLEGILVEKTPERAVINVHGIGYEVCIAPSTSARLKPCGENVTVQVVESSSMYGGTTSLYAFLTSEEKEIFLYFKEYVPNTGAKKAMEYVDKAGKSFADFRSAIQTQNAGLLVSIFGFTKKTADKLVEALKNRVDDHCFNGVIKSGTVSPRSIAYVQAKESLLALGYRGEEIERIIAGFDAQELQTLSTEEFLKKALRKVMQ